MGGRTRWLRARGFASSWFEVLVVAFLVCAVAGGYAAGTAYAASGTTEERRTVERWAVTGAYDHSATVTRENPVFDVGTQLEGRSTYFTDISPVLDGTFRTTYRDTGPDSGPLNATLDAALVVRSTSDSEVLWTERTPLAETGPVTLDGGESAAVNFSVNVSRVNQRIGEIRDALGGSSDEIETFVVVDVNATGNVAGATADRSLSQRLPLSIESSRYSVGQSESSREAVTTARVVAVPRTYGPLWTLGGPLLLLGGLGGLAALAVGYRRDALDLSEREREYLAFRDDRAEFDEWVVRARLPASALDRERAEAETLADLVDFAIDSDVGVVEDSRTGGFYAVTRDLLVAFDPPELRGDPSPFSDRESGKLLGDALGDLVGGGGEDASDGASDAGDAADDGAAGDERGNASADDADAAGNGADAGDGADAPAETDSGANGEAGILESED